MRPRTNHHTTFRPKLSVHPTNHLLWQFTTVTFIHLYDLSTYFLSTPPSGWTVCHLWHNVHPPQNALWHNVRSFLKQNLDGLSQHFWTHLWRPASCLATCGHFVTGFFPTRSRQCPAGFSAKCGHFVALFWTFVMSCHLLSKLLTFCHRICPNTFAMSSRLFSEMWTFVTQLFLPICDDALLPAQQTADVLSQDLSTKVNV